MSTVLNYGIFWLFLALGTNYVIAAVAGYLVGLFFGYYLNRSWTFTSVAERKTDEFALYVFLYLVSLAASISFLGILVGKFFMHPLVANVFAIGLSTVTNFLGSKFLVFHAGALGYLKRIRGYLTVSFWAILGVKVASSFLFGSPFMTQGFIPFVSYFAHTLGNPYDYFAAIGAQVFPYPAGMLFIFSIPFIIAENILPAQIFLNIHTQLFLMRLPIIALDVLLYIILCMFLPTKERKVRLLYFASPILFYINYFHGQLDIVPMFFLFLSLALLFKKKTLPAFAVLGLGIAMKTHIAVAIPFYCIYLYRNKESPVAILKMFLVSFGVFWAVNPFLFSQGFIYSVLNNPEQQRLFSLFIPFGFDDLRFFLAPAALIAILYHFSSYKKLNHDSLLLVLGLAYAVLISLVPPMPGWFYWSVPFLILFFVKFKGAPVWNLWVMNGLYVLYFLFSSDSDVIQSLLPFRGPFRGGPSIFGMLEGAGMNAALFQDILFTLLEASLLLGAFWSYKMGTSTNLLYQEKKSRFVLGIAGDSGVGKSTLADAFSRVVGHENIARLDGDDLHKWERGNPEWNAVSHLNPKANLLHVDLVHAVTLLRGDSIERRPYDHSTGKFSTPVDMEAKKFILFQGLLPFMLEEMRSMFDLKIFMEADEPLRIAWKMARDGSERGYSEVETKAQIERRKPDAEKFVSPQREFADWAIHYAHEGGRTYSTEYIFKNSIGVDGLVEQLSAVQEFSVEHSYVDMNYQRLVFRGEISATVLREVAYRLFPNMFDLVDHDPDILSGISGIHQLFFINFLNHFYLVRLHRARLS